MGMYYVYMYTNSKTSYHPTLVHIWDVNTLASIYTEKEGVVNLLVK